MWFYFALLSAFFNSFGNIARRTHGSLAQPAELAWWTLLLSLPLGVGLLLNAPQPWHTSNAYILPVLLASTLNAYGSVLQFRAYKYGDASGISPITNLLPVLIVFTSFVMLGIHPHPGGFVGILLIVAGVYYTSVNGRHSLFHPFKQLLKNKGSRAMLGCVLLWAVSTNFDKQALYSARPEYLLLIHQLVIFGIISTYLLFRPIKHRVKRGEKVLKKWGWHLAAISVFTTLAVFFQMKAVSLADPSYVLAVKRVDVLFTVLFAGLFLREKHILKRFEGSVIALAGIIVLYIFK